MNFFTPKNVVFFIFLFLFFNSFSQNKNVGIGTTNPDSSAILHLEASDKGFLITRIFLQSLNDVVTIPNPATSLLVYNTNSSIGLGFYYWDGVQWKKAVPAPTSIDSLIVNIATFDTLFASYAIFDTIVSNFISTDTIFANYASFDSVFSSFISTDTLFANFASFDSIYATSANFDSLYINGTSIDSFVSNMIDTTAWKLKGNSGTNPANDFIGTIDSTDFVVRTNNNERVKIYADGNVNVSSLSGSGTRMVTADTLGLLNTQPIPYGIPQGGIIMWSGTIASIPAGWALCDGTNGTPDLTDRFILSVSSSSEDPGATGGANSYSLTTAELPIHNHTGTSDLDGNHNHNLTSASTNSTGSHSHTLTSASTNTAGSHNHSGSTSTMGDHTHGLRGSDSFSGGGNTFETDDSSNDQPRTSDPAGSHGHTISSDGSHLHTLSGSTDAAGNHNHTLSGTTDTAGLHAHTFTTDNAGLGASIDNRPAFYKLAFIMKL